MNLYEFIKIYMDKDDTMIKIKSVEIPVVPKVVPFR